ncbi:MAG: chitobiase/beta-hexosaminidase C-terminal domain-containing protein, partial [Candidatus Binatia bacterium]
TTSGATIFYTTDGLSPTTSSLKYTDPFTVSSSTLVKAKAFKNNLQPSSEASVWFSKADAAGGANLIAQWKFDEGSGTSAFDSSGNGNTATLINGPSWVTSGKIGGALSFDGVDDYLSFASQAQSIVSISAWVYAQAAPDNLFQRIIDMPGYVLFLAESGSPGSNSMSLGFLSRRSTQDGEWDTPANTIAYNSWNHVALVYDSSSTSNDADLYINGLKQTISKITAPQGTQTANEGTGTIGNRIPLDRGWNGMIDDLQLYNRALTNAEIQTIYQKDAAPIAQTIAAPVISPTGGSYSGSVSVAMQTATSSASIYYTTDGATPTQSSSLYTGAMTLTSSVTVKAKAFKGGANASPEASASFIVSQPFSFSLSNAGDKSVVAGSSVT